MNVGAAGTGTSGPSNLDATHLWLDPYGGTASVINLLSGGTLSTARPIGNGSFGNPAYLNINGGYLQAVGNVNIFDNPTPSAPLTVNLQSGGGTIDSNGYNTATLIPLSGIGSLTKVGSGMLTLSASDNYAGITLISAGTLALNNAGALAGSTPGHQRHGSAELSRTDQCHVRRVAGFRQSQPDEHRLPGRIPDRRRQRDQHDLQRHLGRQRRPDQGRQRRPGPFRRKFSLPAAATSTPRAG